MRYLIAALRRVTCEEDTLCGRPDDRRFSEDDIRAITGWNTCRVLLQSLPDGKTGEEAAVFCTSS